MRLEYCGQVAADIHETSLVRREQNATSQQHHHEGFGYDSPGNVLLHRMQTHTVSAGVHVSVVMSRQ